MSDFSAEAFLSEVAAGSSTVLLYGQTGTGKKYLAKKIHAMSPRRDEPFITVDCANVPGKSPIELFLPPMTRRTGVQPGTIFFEKIGRASRTLQKTVFEIVQFRDNAPKKEAAINIPRIIASTSRDLDSMVRSRLFRKDLYRLLNGVKIDLPPLRMRKFELASIANDLLLPLNKKYNRSIIAFTPEAMSCLMAFDWPGNISELEEVLEYCCSMCFCPIIGAEYLPDYIYVAPEEQCDFPLTLEELIQYHAIVSALERYPLDYDAAASAVGLSKSSLLHKARLWEIDMN